MEENEKIVKNIEATMNIEGAFIGEEEKNLIIKYLNKEITEENGIQYIKSKFE